MKDVPKGIEVWIIPMRQGKREPDPYHEYQAPRQSKLARDNATSYGPNVSYITPQGGERFAIQVVVHPHAQFKGQPEFNLRVSMDEKIVFRTSITRPSGRPQHRKIREEFFAYYRPVFNGQTAPHGFYFADAQMSEDSSFLNREETQTAIEQQGKIQVILEVGRSHMKKRTTTPANSASLSSRPAKVTKKVLHDSGKSHFTEVKRLDGRVKPLASKYRVYKPATGNAASKTTFTFLYTSRLYLELQGIVSLIEFPNTRNEPIVIDDRDSEPEEETIKDEPDSDHEPLFVELSDSDVASECRDPDNYSDDSDRTRSRSAVRAPAPIGEESEELYEVTPPRNLRSCSAETSTYLMHGGLGVRDDNAKATTSQLPRTTPAPLVTRNAPELGRPSSRQPSTASDAPENFSAFARGMSNESSRMRWPSSEMEEAEREEREAEMRLLEAKAKRRRLTERLESEGL